MQGSGHLHSQVPSAEVDFKVVAGHINYSSMYRVIIEYKNGKSDIEVMSRRHTNSWPVICVYCFKNR